MQYECFYQGGKKMVHLKKRFFITITLLFMFTIVTACSNSNSDSDKKVKDEAANNVHTLEDAMGKVDIPANPKRIIAPYMEDSLLALGVKPVAQWSIGNVVLDYLQPELKDVPKIGWDVPLEQAMKYNPDLLIFSAPSAIQKGQYEEYKKIAPTYVFKEEISSDWRKQLTQMSKILNKQDKAKEVLADYDKKVSDAKTKIHNSIGDETVAIIWVKGEQIYLFEANRFSAKVLYHDLGMKQPTFIENLPAAEAQWNPLTLEKLPQIGADHLFLVGEKGEAGFDVLKNSSVWNGLDTVKTGHVYEINDPSPWNINGLKASEIVIDDVVNALVK